MHGVRYDRGEPTGRHAQRACAPALAMRRPAPHASSPCCITCMRARTHQRRSELACIRVARTSYAHSMHPVMHPAPTHSFPSTRLRALQSSDPHLPVATCTLAPLLPLSLSCAFASCDLHVPTPPGPIPYLLTPLPPKPTPPHSPSRPLHIHYHSRCASSWSSFLTLMRRPTINNSHIITAGAPAPGTRSCT